MALISARYLTFSTPVNICRGVKIAPGTNLAIYFFFYSFLPLLHFFLPSFNSFSLSLSFALPSLFLSFQTIYRQYIHPPNLNTNTVTPPALKHKPHPLLQYIQTHPTSKQTPPYLNTSPPLDPEARPVLSPLRTA